MAMQSFIDTATQKIWNFEADVRVVDEAGVYSFADARGKPLNVPATLQPYTAPKPTKTQLAATAAAKAQAAYKASASKALAATDNTMNRIAEGVALGEAAWTAPDVVAYVQYRRALRAVLSNADPDVTAALPVAPAYPVGT